MRVIDIDLDPEFKPAPADVQREIDKEFGLIGDNDQPDNNPNGYNPLDYEKEFSKSQPSLTDPQMKFAVPLYIAKVTLPGEWYLDEGLNTNAFRPLESVSGLNKNRAKEASRKLAKLGLVNLTYGERSGNEVIDNLQVTDQGRQWVESEILDESTQFRAAEGVILGRLTLTAHDLWKNVNVGLSEIDHPTKQFDESGLDSIDALLKYISSLHKKHEKILEAIDPVAAKESAA